LSELEGALRVRLGSDVAHEGDRIENVVLGAGPAGLTSAYVLALRQRPGAVFEAGDTVGGIAKTVEFNGYRFDLGGHRFFTKFGPIERLWEDMLGDEMLTRPRLSRIYWDGKYLSYPLKAGDVTSGLGLRESTLCAMSYFAQKMRPNGHEPETFEEWVTKEFGRRLYRTFFKEYTEKVWGIPGSEVQSQWAAQRIKNFSFWLAVLAMLKVRRKHVTTLIEEFRYPRLGPGQMWEAFRDRVEASGIPVHMRQRAEVICRSGSHVESVRIRTNGLCTEFPVDAVYSSIPLSELVLILDPPPEEEVLAAARRLRYRNLCLVALMTDEQEPFPDNWIYLQDPGVKAGRVQNFGAWSKDMVPAGKTCLGVEYFCFEDDDFWRLPEEEAVELAKRELATIGLLDPSRVIDGVKVHVPNAYPMYDSGYEDALAVLRDYVERFDNLRTFGRNGLHRYNNQDHSMWTAILGTLNQLDGTDHDVWSVNTEAEYHEEGEIIDGLLDVELVPA
jgi:protoporphyrinogen oxidase